METIINKNVDPKDFLKSITINGIKLYYNIVEIWGSKETYFYLPEFVSLSFKYKFFNLFGPIIWYVKYNPDDLTCYERRWHGNEKYFSVDFNIESPFRSKDGVTKEICDKLKAVQADDLKVKLRKEELEKGDLINPTCNE